MIKIQRFGSVLVVAALALLGCSSDDEPAPTPPADTGVLDAIGDTELPDTVPPVDTGLPEDTGVAEDTTPADTGGGGDTTGETGPTTHTVQVGPGGANVFQPASLTIKVGDTVQWVWQSAGHSVTESAGASCMPAPSGFDSAVKNDGTFSQTFSTAGTVNYVCTPHCSVGMTGTITVEP